MLLCPVHAGTCFVSSLMVFLQGGFVPFWSCRSVFMGLLWCKSVAIEPLSQFSAVTHP